MVFVGGEAGIGKSRLISELAGRAEREGMTVAVGECLPLGDGELPYAPVVGALRSLMAQREGSELEAMLGSVRGELAVLLPELASDRGGVASPPAGEGSQARLFEQLLALLASAARARPLVLVVEDFQWADRSTCDFFSFFVRAARREPIALIISYRSDELRRGPSPASLHARAGANRPGAEGRAGAVHARGGPRAGRGNPRRIAARGAR